jgi:hypothetical protein
MDADPTQQQGFAQSRAQSTAPGGSSVWYDQYGNPVPPQQPQPQQPQLPGWPTMSPFNPPPAGSPVQQQLQYGQQPQQPQYYAPPMPDFSGILHSLAQHVSTLTQNSIATQQAMTALLQEHATLLNSIQHLNVSNQQMQQALQRAPTVAGGNALFTTKVHTMEKPEKFDGTRNDSARTFLVRFALWAQSLGAQMNLFDAAGNRVGPRHDLWVQSALGYMTGEAAVWAEPYMTQMLSGQTPFLNATTNKISWDEFQTAFPAISRAPF